MCARPYFYLVKQQRTSQVYEYPLLCKWSAEIDFFAVDVPVVIHIQKERNNIIITFALDAMRWKWKWKIDPMGIAADLEDIIYLYSRITMT